MGHRPGRGIGAGRKPPSGIALPVFLLSLVPILAIAWASGSLDFGVWWLTNATSPAVTASSPPAVVRGAVQIDVQLAPSGRARIVDAEVDGRPLGLGEPIVVDTASLPDGPHQAVVVAEDISWRRNRTSSSVSFNSDNTPPQLTFESASDRVIQGHTWLLRIRPDEPAAIQAWLGGKRLEVQAGDGFGWAVVGFSPDDQPAVVPLVVSGTDQVGNQTDQQLSIQVAPGEFPLDRVEVPTTLLPLLASAVRDEEDRHLAPTYSKVTQPRLWEGRFLMPVQGPVITEFATLRSYNGGPVAGHHAGVDLAGPAGRPVVAPNRGRVVLIDETRLRGNLVVLDHGLGVFTTYAHLSAVEVEVGQLVERGQPLARVGSTGLSTGPHLHWELWIGGANVNPLEWTERSFP